MDSADAAATGPVRSEAALDVLTASRALLGLIAQSLSEALEQVTLPQFRVLVILTRSESPQRSGSVAAALGVHPSTFTRTADRLVAGGWVRRWENPENRRETMIALTERGTELVREVTGRRLALIGDALSRLPQEQVDEVVRGMRAFAGALGEPALEDLRTLAL